MDTDRNKKLNGENCNLKKCISNDELSALPLTSFQGEIYIIENIEELNRALDCLKNQPLLGFDTETKVRRSIAFAAVFERLPAIQPMTESFSA